MHGQTMYAANDHWQHSMTGPDAPWPYNANPNWNPPAVNPRSSPYHPTSMHHPSQPSHSPYAHQAAYLSSLGGDSSRQGYRNAYGNHGPVPQQQQQQQQSHPYPNMPFPHLHATGYPAPPMLPQHPVKQAPPMMFYGGFGPMYDMRSVPPSMLPAEYNFPTTPMTTASLAGHNAPSAPYPPPPAPLTRRGPPRKPKRSGHAIWVGNIPIGASIDALKDHFARDATAEIESVFYMQRSNCAFVNFNTEDACAAAVGRHNHASFGNVRLLCRMRKDAGSTPSSSSEKSLSSPPKRAISTGRADSLISDEAKDHVHALGEKLDSLSSVDGIIDEPTIAAPTTNSPPSPPAEEASSYPALRYFVLKSLSKDDLHESLRTGTWETQPHNQKTLHDALRAAEAVYLVFSVNKSGEYFGYARMLSSPFDDVRVDHTTTTTTAPSSQPQQQQQQQQPQGLLRVIKTPPTATAPAGQIVDDPARSTLFWEAMHEDGEGDGEGEGDEMDLSVSASSSSSSCSSGTVPRPFRVEWCSVRKVTFQRVKGIKNAWNAGKDVKVARDGTELETGVGERILDMFHEGVVGGGGAEEGLGRR